MIYLTAIFLIIIIILLNALISNKAVPFLVGKKRAITLQEKIDFQRQWKEIKELLSIPGTISSNQSVIKADQLLDQVLIKKGYQGKTLGERLKSSRDGFSSYQVYDTAWKAHKMRNAIVHEAALDLLKINAQNIIKEYETVFKDLGAL